MGRAAKAAAEQNETKPASVYNNDDVATGLPSNFQGIDEAAELADALHKQKIEESALAEDKEREKAEIFVLGGKNDNSENNVGPDMDKEKSVNAKIIMSQD